MLLADPEWGRWSDSEIARRAGVSRHLVSSLRMLSQVQDERIARRGVQVYTVRVPARVPLEEDTPENQVARLRAAGAWETCPACDGLGRVRKGPA